MEKLVEIEVDHDISNTAVRRAELRLETSCEKYVEKIENLKGDPASPLSQQEIADKFLRYSQASVTRLSAQKFMDALLVDQGGLIFADLWKLLF